MPAKCRANGETTRSPVCVQVCYGPAMPENQRVPRESWTHATHAPYGQPFPAVGAPPGDDRLSILLLEPETDAAYVQMLFSAYEVTLVTSLEQARRALRLAAPVLVIVDVTDGDDGLQLCREA